MTNKPKTLSTTSAVIECILFLENRTLSIGEIARLSHISEDRVQASLDEIKVALDEASHGIVLEKSEEGYQFVPRTTLYERLKRTYGKKVDTRLSKAAIETLTIIAYNQPVKRREIDNIRGTNSEDIVKRLRELEYIKIIDKTDEPGHPARYGTTRKFLYDFNLNSIADLPRLDEEDSERFEEFDEYGNVLSGAEIKRRMRIENDEIVDDSAPKMGANEELLVIDETENKEAPDDKSDAEHKPEALLIKHQKNYAESKEDDENNPGENNDFADGFEGDEDAKDASDTSKRESEDEDDEDRGLNGNADQLDLFGDGNDDEE